MTASANPSQFDDGMDVDTDSNVFPASASVSENSTQANQNIKGM
jgi:hypothetical protein